MVTCVKCGTPMDFGFLLDRGESNTRLTLEWVEGQPEKSFWAGLKLKGRRRIPVAAVRCQRCGYVELYANLP
ncbi:MAG TPA: hypothetical protein VF746_08300 [Longimicrobium sp.]|jgi:hypothetical protein